MLSVSSQSLDRPLILGDNLGCLLVVLAVFVPSYILITESSFKFFQRETSQTMSSFPYVGLDEIKNDKIGTLKALFAEFIGTGILVKFRKDILYSMDHSKGLDLYSKDKHFIKIKSCKTGLNVLI